MSIKWQLIFACTLACQSALGQPTVGAVVNGASFEPSISPGSLISIYGTQLASATVYATSLPLPKLLGSTSVLIDGTEIPLYFVSPTQINAQVPFALGDHATLTIRNGSASSSPYVFGLFPTSPSIFSQSQDGKGRALAFDGNFRLLDRIGDESFILYATGLGETQPAGTAGEAGASVEPLQRAVEALDVYVGEKRATVEFAGLAPGFAGVFQVNVKPPSGTLSNRIYLRSKGRSSNFLELSTQSGNLTPLSAKIEPLYPSAGLQSSIIYSPLLVAARLNLHLKMPIDGQPHSVAAVAEDAYLLIEISASGHYDAVLTTPIVAVRSGDFRGIYPEILDFACPSPGCPMPGNIVPPSRMDQQMRIVLENQLPLPNESPWRSATGLLRVSGEAPPDSSFMIGENSHPELRNFGAFVSRPYPVRRDRSIWFRLYIDGALVDSQEVRYTEGSQ